MQRRNEILNKIYEINVVIELRAKLFLQNQKLEYKTSYDSYSDNII